MGEVVGVGVGGGGWGSQVRKYSSTSTSKAGIESGLTARQTEVITTTPPEPERGPAGGSC